MLRRIFNILRIIQTPPLGRWCLKDKSKSNWKTDTANMDHCGTCWYEKPEALEKHEKHEKSTPIKQVGTEKSGQPTEQKTVNLPF